MISYGGKELADAFRTVRKNTIQVAEDIPESKYDFVAAPEVRPVRKMLTHVAIATRIWEERKEEPIQGGDRAVAALRGRTICGMAGEADAGVPFRNRDRA